MVSLFRSPSLFSSHHFSRIKATTGRSLRLVLAFILEMWLSVPETRGDSFGIQETSDNPGELASVCLSQMNPRLNEKRTRESGGNRA